MNIMTIEQQIEWVEGQLKYSIMLEDGDAKKWEAVKNSLIELQNDERSAADGFKKRTLKK